MRDLEQKAEVRRSETGKRNPNFIPTRFKPLGSMMRDAYEWGRIDLDPTTRVKLPVCEPVRPDEEEADEASKILLPDELARLDTTASDEEDTRLRLEGEVLLDLGSKQGLRVGEMRGTRWPDFDFERDRHYVRRQIERGTNAVKEPKMRSKRVLPLSPRVAAALQELRAWQVANGHDPMGYVFPGREPGTPRSYSALRDRLERLQR